MADAVAEIQIGHEKLMESRIQDNIVSSDIPDFLQHVSDSEFGGSCNPLADASAADYKSRQTISSTPGCSPREMLVAVDSDLCDEFATAIGTQLDIPSAVLSAESLRSLHRILPDAPVSPLESKSLFHSPQLRKTLLDELMSPIAVDSSSGRTSPFLGPSAEASPCRHSIHIDLLGSPIEASSSQEFVSANALQWNVEPQQQIPTIQHNEHCKVEKDEPPFGFSTPDGFMSARVLQPQSKLNTPTPGRTASPVIKTTAHNISTPDGPGLTTSTSPVAGSDIQDKSSSTDYPLSPERISLEGAYEAAGPIGTATLASENRLRPHPDSEQSSRDLSKVNQKSVDELRSPMGDNDIKAHNIGFAVSSSVPASEVISWDVSAPSNSVKTPEQKHVALGHRLSHTKTIVSTANTPDQPQVVVEARLLCGADAADDYQISNENLKLTRPHTATDVDSGSIRHVTSASPFKSSAADKIYILQGNHLPVEKTAPVPVAEINTAIELSTEVETILKVLPVGRIAPDPANAIESKTGVETSSNAQPASFLDQLIQVEVLSSDELEIIIDDSPPRDIADLIRTPARLLPQPFEKTHVKEETLRHLHLKHSIEVPPCTKSPKLSTPFTKAQSDSLELSQSPIGSKLLSDEPNTPKSTFGPAMGQLETEFVPIKSPEQASLIRRLDLSVEPKSPFGESTRKPPDTIPYLPRDSNRLSKPISPIANDLTGLDTIPVYECSEKAALQVNTVESGASNADNKVAAEPIDSDVFKTQAANIKTSMICKLDLQDAYIPKAPFQRLNIGIIDFEKSPSESLKYIFLIEDSFSKHCMLFALKSISVDELSKSFYAYERYYGTPKYICCVGDTQLEEHVKQIHRKFQVTVLGIRIGASFDPLLQAKGTIKRKISAWRAMFGRQDWHNSLYLVEGYLNNTTSVNLPAQETPWSVTGINESMRGTNIKLYDVPAANDRDIDAAAKAGILPECIRQVLESFPAEGDNFDDSLADISELRQAQAALDDLRERTVKRQALIRKLASEPLAARKKRRVRKRRRL